MLQKNQMVKLTASQKAARKAIESTYTGFCDVIEYGNAENNDSHFTKKEETTVYTDIPCRLSYSKFNNMYPATSSDTASSITQLVKIFLAPEIKIKSGSKIVVTQNGITTAYKSSSEPSYYTSHQEISVELFRGWT